MGIHALTADNVIASSPNDTIKRGGWICPPVGFIKLNADSSFDQDLLRGIVGAVMREDKGKFVVGELED